MKYINKCSINKLTIKTFGGWAMVTTLVEPKAKIMEESKTEAPITANENENPFEIVKGLLKEAVQNLELDEGVYRLLQKPMRILEVSIPIRRDNGQIMNYTGYRSQHIDILGPTKGGIRFHPKVNLDEVRALSMWMSLKSAILGLPFGGGKGGVIVDPKDLTERELEELSRSYIRSLTPIIGPEKDIPAPDVNTNPQIMGWMLDEYDKLRGYNVPGFITGKPLIIGGSQGRVEATGRGVVITIVEAAKKLNIELKGATAAIQGFGNVGSMTAKFLHELGVKIVAITDSKGGIYAKDGMDIPKLVEYAKDKKMVSDFPGCENMDSNKLFGLPVDILIPAALENQITEKTAPTIQAKIVAEAANGPTTPAGDRILDEKGVFIIPDILCNSGGVTVSYFEWVQNTMGYYWKEQEVNEKLEEKMVNAFHDVYRMTEEKRADMRSAAYMVGVGRLAEALKARGWIKNWSMPFKCKA
jgi:glutamate dehydrogenase